MSKMGNTAAPAQLTYVRPNVFRFTNLSDSQGKASTTRNQATDFFTFQVCERLRDLGANVSDRNWGISGNRTPDILARLGCIFTPYYPPASEMPNDRVIEIPDILAIEIGVNDPFASISTAQTTLNIRAAIRGAKYGAAGIQWQGIPQVNGVSNLPANVAVGTLYQVTADTDATGGLTPTLAGPTGAALITTWECHLANTGGASGWGRVGLGNVTVGTPANLPGRCLRGQRMLVMVDSDATGGAIETVGLTPTVTGNVGAGGISVWECRTKHSGVRGWGRVSRGDGTTPFTHVNPAHIFVVGAPYLNWASGGDNHSTSTVYALYDDVTGVRKAQIDAAAAEGAHYNDLYNYLLARILAGLDTQGDSTSWQTGTSNQHLIPPGQSYCADGLVTDILALSPIVGGRYTGLMQAITLQTP